MNIYECTVCNVNQASTQLLQGRLLEEKILINLIYAILFVVKAVKNTAILFHFGLFIIRVQMNILLQLNPNKHNDTNVDL